MNINEIVKDSIKYPFSNWKNFLILGIIAVLTAISSEFPLPSLNYELLSIITLIEVIAWLIFSGYIIKLVKSSSDGVNELPDFNKWGNMFTDGFKVFIVYLAYLIPLLVITIIVTLSLGSSLGTIISNPSALDTNGLFDLGIIVIIAGLYIIIAFPIALMSQVNMAVNDSKFTAAFRFREIFNKIGNIGWGQFVKWYIVTGILLIIMFVIMSLLIIGISLINPLVGSILVSLLVVPYIDIYIYRSAALIYKSEKNQ